MNISELSIRRPVLSTVLTLIILLFGFIGYSYLGVREYPSVDNPIIRFPVPIPVQMPMLSRIRLPNRWNRTSTVFPVSARFQASASRDNAALP